jgi:hypothetical protein
MVVVFALVLLALYIRMKKNRKWEYCPLSILHVHGKKWPPDIEMYGGNRSKGCKNILHPWKELCSLFSLTYSRSQNSAHGRSVGIPTEGNECQQHSYECKAEENEQWEDKPQHKQDSYWKNYGKEERYSIA